MLPNLLIASFLSACLTVFFVASMYGFVRRTSVDRKSVDFEAEVELPFDLAFALSALGTGVFFLLSVLNVGLIVVGLDSVISSSFLQLTFLMDSCVQLVGMVLTAGGYALFIWSVLARGKYATSWEMPSDQKLVTWGPYRYVRHPSYLAYFILFAGLFLLLLNLVALVPLAAVPGYVHITALEDEMLRKRFGEAALEYQRATGRFLPKRKRHA
jgi:protein-S-isoprenylcysteine O-methyltransferase Ste14